MKLAIVYTSKTGHTEELVHFIRELFLEKNIEVHLFRVEHFPLQDLSAFDAVVIGTYTWGDGEIPEEMHILYRSFESQDIKHVVTGVVGTGDSFYPQFCGAVDAFRDMLYVHSNLAVTLKIEIALQTKDHERCQRFVEILWKKLKNGVRHHLAKT
ncbi:flavodoxin domain-containing protein [Neobacillus vireti]|uniref:Flavodoxin n=1 Tax=Neobacillus vireti LMG 21834 TaxID=1131730 RepID=A0AB94ISZ5_9BACI|nr:flavodoxin domain-containing protein [Neobacillus vireti]ETI70201.1 flavodoxin [Neobacillus vireti LMG 21834]KLT16435.1 flavodoxin [Neobacillus vireti]